ncbi:MAG TPA: bifunctional diaminohydroxyphosphoribosylaminopyrimidine deaminase/5-amino-6-(5-phosphoribosylamino)uracil reductase RibD [Gammaproteobacteria bacterium]|nr:bifunctional diaminohydroxyphosphoribosylaminopyrimidine deaminase/5-amino-6-(5-phosphoribosylamino)uracil reductase RibD [Gammaproteobacteria bacterium]
MGHALRLAQRGLYTTDPNPRVGCVLVRDDKVVGEGWHRRAGGDHAEVAALRQAGEAARGATAYVTLEPCCHHGRTPPCTEALLRAGVVRVVAAMVDPNPQMAGQGLAALEAAGVETTSGLCAAQAAALNPGYVLRMERGWPLVRCKLAMTLDGRTATAAGESRWITSAEARRDVQRLRARSSAIMTGVGTVLADDPALTVRLETASGEDWRQPLRVVLDTKLRTPVEARLLTESGETLILTAHEDMARIEALETRGATVACLPARGGRVDLEAALRHLAGREVNEVLVEAGPVLAGAMLAAGLVDELVLYVAPRLLGSEGRGLFQLPGLERLADAVALEIAEVRAVGRDWRITALPAVRQGPAPGKAQPQ